MLKGLTTTNASQFAIRYASVVGIMYVRAQEAIVGATFFVDYSSSKAIRLEPSQKGDWCGVAPNPTATRRETVSGGSGFNHSAA